MSTPRRPRVALCGISLESNAFSPVAGEADFRALCYLEGEELLAAVRGEASTAAMEMVGFVGAMDVTGPWEPVPLLFTASHPWGPVRQDFFDRVLEDIVARLRASGGVDAVYVANHGAMVATGSPDPDGDMLSRLRAAVGPEIPIVATLDLHANVSEAMVEAADVLISYQTNPHVDMLERGEEAAHVLRAILGGAVAPKAAFVRMPIVPPSVTLLTREGPYADLIDYGQRRKRELAGEILNVSILGDFAFSDTPFNGIGIVVTGRTSLDPAQRLAREIAERCWADRGRFRKSLTALDDAVRMAVENGEDPRRPPLIFSDAGDNPGGGGGGDTVELLRALIESGARGVLYGSWHDPALVADARSAGEGASMTAVFNRDPKTAFAERLEVPARVVKLSSEPFVGRLGIYAGRKVRCQPSCALELGGEGGILVVAISNRYQTADPMFFEHLGLDIAAARHRVREVARTLPRRIRAVVPSGAGRRGGHRGVDLAGARAPGMEGTAPPGLPPGRKHRLGAPKLVTFPHVPVERGRLRGERSGVQAAAVPEGRRLHRSGSRTGSDPTTGACVSSSSGLGLHGFRGRLQRLDHCCQHWHLFLALRHRQQQVRDQVHANLELGARESFLGDLAREIAVNESRKGLLNVPKRLRTIRSERIARSHVHVPVRGDEVRTNPMAMTIVGLPARVPEPAAKPGMGHTLGDPLKKRLPLFSCEQLGKPAVDHVFVNHGSTEVFVGGSPRCRAGRKEHDSIAATP